MLSFAFDVHLWKNQNWRLLLMRRRLYQDNRGAMKTVKVTQLVRPYWKYLIVAFVAIIVESGGDLLEPWPLKIALDYVIGSKKAPGWLSGLVGVTFGDDKFALLNFAA